MQFRYGALFDMDGVIVDNAEYHMLAYQEWCKERNVSFDAAYFDKHLFGRQNFDIFKSLLGRELPPDELRAEAAYKEALYRKVYADHIQPVCGVVEFVGDLKANGFGVAMATSGPPENAALILNSLRIDHHFDAVLTNKDVIQGKPDPQVFLLAAKKLGLSPERCVVFEDSTAGAQAAVASGGALVGVATAHAHLEGAVRMISDFRSITAVQAIELIEESAGKVQVAPRGLK